MGYSPSPLGVPYIWGRITNKWPDVVYIYPVDTGYFAINHISKWYDLDRDYCLSQHNKSHEICSQCTRKQTRNIESFINFLKYFIYLRVFFYILMSFVENLLPFKYFSTKSNLWPVIEYPRKSNQYIGQAQTSYVSNWHTLYHWHALKQLACTSAIGKHWGNRFRSLLNIYFWK